MSGSTFGVFAPLLDLGVLVPDLPPLLIGGALGPFGP